MPFSVPSPKTAVCVHLFLILTVDFQVPGVTDIPAFIPRSLIEPCTLPSGIYLTENSQGWDGSAASLLHFSLRITLPCNYTFCSSYSGGRLF